MHPSSLITLSGKEFPCELLSFTGKIIASGRAIGDSHSVVYNVIIDDVTNNPYIDSADSDPSLSSLNDVELGTNIVWYYLSYSIEYGLDNTIEFKWKSLQDVGQARTLEIKLDFAFPLVCSFINLNFAIRIISNGVSKESENDSSKALSALLPFVVAATAVTALSTLVTFTWVSKEYYVAALGEIMLSIGIRLSIHDFSLAFQRQNISSF
ncbi:hypothetical protein GIB67_020936 [Kingdonia uniflora]|uniref:Uncharacterized protein n=1 Tax=Kingdonia uniflora TaxID=39325 RepID=A0A7J7M7K8_9MAGN|nr:hypothetical protein GIB67_020936 [Kingdonia uniflora]